MTQGLIKLCPMDKSAQAGRDLLEVKVDVMPLSKPTKKCCLMGRMHWACSKAPGICMCHLQSEAVV